MSDRLKIGEAAEFLGVSKETLRNWDRSGKLSAERDPNSNYRLYDLDKLIQMKAKSESEVTEGGSVVSESASNQKTLFAERSSESHTRQDLQKLVWKMSAAFRDSLGGGLLERFEEITKLLYAKLYDEQKSQEDRRFFRKEEPVEDTYQRISTLYTEAYDELPDDFSGGRRELGEDKRAIAEVVELLQEVELQNISVDIKGVVFEELVKDTFEKSENQQFFTPRQVVETIVAAVNPQPDELICDPGCGTGGFLIGASEHIKQGDHKPEEDGGLVGIEIDRRMAWVAQMNLVMHGDGRGRVYRLPNGGSLSHSEMDDVMPPESVDVILTNPPFGSEVKRDDILSEYSLGKGRDSRRRGVLFLERCIELLKPGGRAGIIIEDSVLNGASNDDVRNYVLDHCSVEAVISLPEETFMPYATVEASILLLEKKEGVDQSGIFMADVEKVGKKSNGDPDYRLDDPTSEEPELDSELPEVVEAWWDYRSDGASAIEHLRPKIFTCPPRRFGRQNGERRETRLDVQYHHPSRNTAEKTLGRSEYPVHKLGELVVFRNDRAVPNDEDPRGVWKYMGLGDIEAETGRYQVRSVLGREVKSSVRRFEGGDIVFSKMRPKLRKCVLIDSEEDGGYASSECYVMRTPEAALEDPELRESAVKRKAITESMVVPEYLALMLRSDIVYGQLVYQVTGVGRPRVNKSTILNIQIPLPPEGIQREIIDAHHQARNEYAECMRRIDNLKEKSEAALNEARDYTVKQLCPQD